MEQEESYEYELIDIEFEEDEFASLRVMEDGDIPPQIVYDADGIPMGSSQEEKLIRREIIHKFIQHWRNEHDNPRLFNENLNEYIKINHVFLVESELHSAIRYESTKAIMNMEEVMAKAKKIGEVKAKEGKSNQKPFEKMIVMRYHSEGLGAVKITIGVRNRTHEKVGYSITVPEKGIPFINETSNKDPREKKKHHK